MKKFNLEISVGIFLLVGILCMAYISINLGEMEVFSSKRYTVYAHFDKVGGVKEGAVVEIAGIKVGVVKGMELENYQAKLVLGIDSDIQLQEDAIASIKTKGLIGEKYVEITPGGSDEIIPPEGNLIETESATDIQDLISKYAFGDVE